MWLFKKKTPVHVVEIKCPSEGCAFICSDHVTLKKHTTWKHPELTQDTTKVK